MHNTHFAYADLVYRRLPSAEDDLVDIEFADMEPLNGAELVGVAPLEAIAVIQRPVYDLVGVGAHAAIASDPDPRTRRRMFGRGPLVAPEDAVTEEFGSWPED